MNDKSTSDILNIINACAHGLVVVDRAGIIQCLNPAALALFGQSADCMIGTLLGYSLKPEVTQTVDVEKSNGKTLTAEMNIAEIEWNGEPAYLVSLNDITRHKEVTEALQSSEERYRDMVENINDVIYAIDDRGIVTYISPVIEQVGGYTPSEVIGRSFSDFIHQEDLSRLLEEFQLVLKGKAEPSEYRVLDKTGNTHWVRSFSRPIMEKDQTVGLYGVMADITQQHVLEEQLRQTQKMDAVGKLASGVAHDFNNLLTVINGYAELLLKQMHSTDPLYLHADEIRKAGDQAMTLTSQLLAFSRRQKVQPQVLDLNTVIQENIKMIQRLISEDIELVTSFSIEPGCVYADRGQVSQVLLNLAINGRDAMPRGGRISIETKHVTLDESFVKAHLDTPPGSYVQLTVKDSGEGIDEDVKTHIFEPFFTTKEAGKGTGLGLFTVYGIVKQNHGHIEVVSEKGQGTVFSLYFPLAPISPEGHCGQTVYPSNTSGKETILVIEDDNEVRRLTRTILALNGYKILEASNGEEALETCDRYANPIHLVITDIVMPRMSGIEVADRLSHLASDVKILYMSGYPQDAIAQHGQMLNNTGFLQKPFTPVTLTSAVHDLLV